MRKYIIALFFIVLAFDGLNNLREITDLAIVQSMGLDLTDDGKYKITAIVLDTSQTSSSGGEKNTSNSGIIYEAEGDSVQEAIRNIVDISPKKLYLAHMESLIICENIASKELENSLDFFIRDNEGSNNFYLFVSSDCKANDFIKVLNEEQVSMKEMLFSSVKYRGNSNLETLNDTIKDILRPGKDISINCCSIKEDKVKINNMAYFKGWNLQGFLDDKESIIYNMLDNNLENAIITSGEENKLAVAEIISSKSKMSLKSNTVNIRVNIKANISETGEDITIDNCKDTARIEEELEAKLTGEINDYINKIKTEYKTDLIGIGNLLYRKNNDLFYDEEYLSKIKVNVEVDVKLLNQGGVIKRW